MRIPRTSENETAAAFPGIFLDPIARLQNSGSRRARRASYFRARVINL